MCVLFQTNSHDYLDDVSGQDLILEAVDSVVWPVGCDVIDAGQRAADGLRFQAHERRLHVAQIGLRHLVVVAIVDERHLDLTRRAQYTCHTTKYTCTYTYILPWLRVYML